MRRTWAVTSYFNPLRWRSRRENHRAFRAHLEVPLLTVEWDPEGRFELDRGDADRLIQVSGGDLMWQKERLLEVGIRALPDEAATVAWLDADVVLADPRWPAKAEAALEQHDAVQLFRSAAMLDAAGTEALRDAGSVPERLLAGADAPSSASLVERDGVSAFDGFHVGSPGMAWAARRETLEHVGLFDRAIVGSGDFFWLVGVLGIGNAWLEARAGKGLYDYLAKSSYGAWSARAGREVGSVGALDGVLLHLHHGALDDRRYFERHRPMNELGIDIDRDIEHDPGGAWRFVDPRPAWTEMMRDYFAGRREDPA